MRGEGPGERGAWARHRLHVFVAVACACTSCIVWVVTGAGGRGAAATERAGLLETWLAMYPVDGKAVSAYLLHQGRAGALGVHASKSQERGGQRSARAQQGMARLRRKASSFDEVPPDRSQKLSEDTDDLDNALSVVHAEPLEDATMKPENQYTVAGTSFPTHVRVVQPADYSFDAAPTPAPAAKAGGAEGEAGEEGESGEAEPACEGPVRHLDSAACVARKALAQALQAEKDVQRVDSRIGGVRRQTASTRAWENARSEAIDRQLAAGIAKAQRGLRVQGRALDTTERRLRNGDQTSMQKIALFQAREEHDMASVLRRVKALEQEVKVIPKITGPPGSRGRRGPRGPQVCLCASERTCCSVCTCSICMCVCVCVYIYIYIYMYIYMYTCTYTCMYIYVYIHIYVHVHIYTYDMVCFPRRLAPCPDFLARPWQPCVRASRPHCLRRRDAGACVRARLAPARPRCC